MEINFPAVSYYEGIKISKEQIWRPTYVSISLLVLEANQRAGQRERPHSNPWRKPLAHLTSG